jgi:alcohol dehydrogenase (NADP+)
VGAMNSACFKPDCEECSSGREQYCPHMVVTYASTYPDGSRSHGGYGNYHRSHSGLVFKIPDGLPSEQAAPFLCAGITMYSPLKQNGCGPDKRVGVIGIGQVFTNDVNGMRIG